MSNASTAPNHSQPPSSNHTRPHNRPPRPLHRLITQLPPRIPNQMPDPPKTMISKRPRNPKLDQELRRWPQRSESRRHTNAIEMPSESRGDEIRGAEDVEAPAKDGSCYAVCDAAVPRYLRAVNGEMGRDGAIEALVFEDRVGVLGGDGRGCGGSGRR